MCIIIIICCCDHYCCVMSLLIASLRIISFFRFIYFLHYIMWVCERCLLFVGVYFRFICIQNASFCKFFVCTNNSFFLIHKELTLSLPLSLSLKKISNLNWYNTVDSATVEQKIILKSFQSMSMFAKSITRMNWIWNDWVANFDFNEKELDLIL